MQMRYHVIYISIYASRAEYSRVAGLVVYRVCVNARTHTLLEHLYIYLTQYNIFPEAIKYSTP